MEGRLPRVSGFVSRAERRRQQNRLNQRTARRRRVNQNKASENLCVSQTNLANAGDGDSSDLTGENQSSQALLNVLLYSTNLDQVRTLYPALADPLTRNIWSTAVNVLWPSLEYNDLRGSGGELTRSFFRSSAADPLLFSAFTCTSSIAIAMTTESSRTVHNLALVYELRAVEYLKAEFLKGLPSPRDELVFAMLLLSSRITDQIAVAERTQIGAFRPPLINLHNLVVGSSLRFGTVHRDMLKTLVAQKGGVSNLTLPYLGEFFNTMDLYQSSTRCEKPDFGLCKSYLDYMHSSIRSIRLEYRATAEVPLAFPTAALEESFEDLLWDIRCYLHLVELYCRQTWPQPSRVPLALYRNTIQHRILSLDLDPSENIKAICYVSLRLFSCVVIYPLQNLVPLHQYLNSLTQLLEDADGIEDDFRLWLLFLGAMSSDGMSLQSWYLSRLKTLITRLGHEWPTIKEILRTFLWLDMACGEGALEVWYQAISPTASHPTS